MLDNTKGVPLIIAIFIIVVLAFMGVMLLTMVGTSTFTSVNDAQSTQALSIAEGGVEYEQRILAQNVDWYRSPDPVDTTSPNLGGSSLIAVTNIPATKLKKRLLPGKTPATVYSTNRFPRLGHCRSAMILPLTRRLCNTLRSALEHLPWLFRALLLLIRGEVMFTR